MNRKAHFLGLDHTQYHEPTGLSVMNVSTAEELVDIVLEAGSLLIMKGKTQENWLHSLPKTTKVTFPRVNLTFRNIYT